MSAIDEDNVPDGVFLSNLEAEIADLRATGICHDAYLFEQSILKLRSLNVDLPRQRKAMTDAVTSLYIVGNPSLGVDILLTSRALFDERAELFERYSFLSLFGVCAADTNDLASAMQAYGDALVLAERVNDDERIGKIWHNLGAALAYTGLYREANIAWIKSMQHYSRELQLAKHLTGVYTNIAVSHLYLDEPTLGIKALEFADKHMPSMPNDAHFNHQKVLKEVCQVKLLIEIGDIEMAKAHAIEARHYADSTGTPRADVSATVAEALVEVYSGQPEIGIPRLVKVIEKATALKITTNIHRATLVKALEHLSRHEEALAQLQEMLNLQRAAAEENILRQVERHLEQLHAITDHAQIEDPKKAIKQLEMRQEVLEGRIAKEEIKRNNQDAEQAKRELFRLSIQSLERVAVTAEMRDDASGEHSYRVGRLASLLAKEAGCDEATVFMIEIAAGLNDIGKIAIPDGILLKPGRLNASERQIMEVHAETGADMLAKSNIPQIQMAEDIARYHHERWDGTGYPKGLIGEAIPLAARITALADVFDALTHRRPYKPAWPADAALIEILSQRGQHFDPTLTDLFVGLISRLLREGYDLDILLGEAAKRSSFNQAKEKIWDSLRLDRGR